MVSSVTTGSEAGSSSGVQFADAKDRGTLSREDFMRLFVTQLSYQDPMNPMESAEMASQVAQFNMVDLMYKNNEAMERLVASDEANTRLQALGFLGREVRYEGGRLTVGPEGPGSFDLKVDGPVATCVITVRDAAGHVVKTWDAERMTAGKHPLQWDGTDAGGAPVPEGTYQVSVLALDAQGNEVPVTTWTTGSVSQVEYSETGLPMLTMEDGAQIGLDELWIVGS